jgi:predicted CXXCH cytochrome family protein
MTTTVRVLLAAVLLAAVVGTCSLLQTEAPVPVPEGDRAPFQRASECRDCHAEVYAEWEQSYHAMAWTDPMVQDLTNGFRMTECIDCHAPQPIHMTGVTARVAPRQHAREDGVDCLSCHLLDDGVGVAASRTVDTSAVPGACRPLERPVMAGNEVCAGCHNQHESVDELLESGVPETCQDCHMEPAQRTSRDGTPRAGLSHVFPGGHWPEMHRRAVRLDVRVADGHVVATVTNVGGGHHVPTDSRHRSYNVRLTARDGRGNPLVTDHELAEYRLYYRDQFRPTTQIPHGESRESRWPVPRGVSGRALVRLTYALNPDELAAGKFMEVAEQEVSFP